jgi:thymidylate kinase
LHYRVGETNSKRILSKKKRDEILVKKELSMIVCIEGTTGAGKSTLAKKVVDEVHTGFRLCPNMDFFLDGNPVCEYGSKGVETNFFIYLKGELRAAQFMTQEGGDWIQDRNWISQITFVRALEEIVKIKPPGLMLRLIELLKNGDLVYPDVFIYISCTPDLTAIRRTQRGSTPWGDVPKWLTSQQKIVFRKVRYEIYERLFTDVLNNVITIDANTSEKCNDRRVEFKNIRMVKALRAENIKRLKAFLNV